MNRKFSRRRFLASAVGRILGGCSRRAAVRGEGPPRAGKALDIHVHLFGTGDAGSGCRLSKTTSHGLLFKFLSATAALSKRAKTLDEGYVLALAEQVEKSGLDKAVILAQDAVYDRNGKPDWDKTQFYIPNDYLFQVVARYPARMVPCVSINPARADAVAELERGGKRRPAAEDPSSDPGRRSDRKKACPVLPPLRDLKMIVMVHTGHEHAAPIFIIELADPRKLELALDSGCTVVACHCGTGRQRTARTCCRGSWRWSASTRICGAIRRSWAAGGSAIFNVCLPTARRRSDCSTAATFPFQPFRLTLRASSG